MLYCFSVLVEYFKYHALVLLLNSVFRLNSCELSINISVDLPDNCAKSVLFCGVHNLTPDNRNPSVELSTETVDKSGLNGG